MGLFSRKNKVEQQAAPVAEPAAAAPAGIPGEVIAAISAAVACMFGEGARVRSVRRSGGSAGLRSSWSTASLLENTRPF